MVPVHKQHALNSLLVVISFGGVLATAWTVTFVGMGTKFFYDDMLVLMLH